MQMVCCVPVKYFPALTDQICGCPWCDVTTEQIIHTSYSSWDWLIDLDQTGQLSFRGHIRGIATPALLCHKDTAQDQDQDPTNESKASTFFDQWEWTTLILIFSPLHCVSEPIENSVQTGLGSWPSLNDVWSWEKFLICLVPVVSVPLMTINIIEEVQIQSRAI